MRNHVSPLLFFRLFLLLTMNLCLVWLVLPAVASEARVERGHLDPYERAYIDRFLKSGEYLPVSDVKEGDTGYGLSVFHGMKVEKFDVKVLGVMKQVLNGRDSILIKISGDVLGKNNVVRGMSGSPIYIKNKLVGALSYGFDFSMEPIVGVTPIVDMLDAIIKPTDQRTLRLTGHSLESLSMPLSISSIEGSGQELDRLKRSIMSTSLGAGAPKMVPLMSPVALSGFSSRARSFLADRFKGIGLDVSGGASGGLNKELSSLEGGAANRLVPGSALGLLLSTGDFSSAATGTVTGIFHDRVLGFGHPLMEAGAIDVPMASAYIHEVLPSLSVSFKLSSPLKVLGRIFADRPWSVGGELGKNASMIPVDITVIDGQRHFRKDFSSQVINHPNLSSDLISAIIMSAMDASFQSTDPYTVNLKSRIKIKDGRLLEREDSFASFASASSGLSILGLKFFSDPVVNYVDSIVSRIYNNRYKKEEVESVKLTVTFNVGKNTTALKRVIAEDPVVEPGEKVRFTCVLSPYNKKRYTETFEFEVPRDLPDGEYMVGVTGGSSYDGLRKTMKLFDPPTKNLDQELDRILDDPHANELIALLALPDQAVHINNAVIQNPPGHWSKLFFSDRYTNGPSIVPGEKLFKKRLDSYVTGSHVVGFTVKRKAPYLEEDSWYQSDSGSGKGSSGSHITGQARKVIGSLTKVAKSTGTTTESSGVPVSGSTDSKAGKTSGAQSANFAGDLTGLHTRFAKAWSQSTDSSFTGGKKENCTIDSWGRLFPGFEVLESGDCGRVRGEVRAWASAMVGNNFYFSAGNKIYVYEGSKSSTLVSMKTTMIPAMASAGETALYAACVPEGKVVKVGTEGSVKDFFKTKESVIASLCTDASGNLYVGAAGSGRIYKVGAGGNLLQTIDSGQAHITSLNYCPNTGRVMVGTGESGNVYSFDPAVAGDGLRGEYQSGAHIVTGAAWDKRGNLFITTAGPGSLVMVEKSGKSKNLATSEAFYHLYYDRFSDSIFTGDAEGDVTQIQIEPLPKRAFFVPVHHTNQEAVISISGDSDSNLFILTSNLPTVSRILFRPSAGAVYTSKVNDGGRPSRWSRLRVFGAYNQFEPAVRSAISVETRTGDTLRPDASWQGWQAAVAGDDGFKLGSRPGRFFQYRLSWTPGLKAGGADGQDRVFPCGHETVIGMVETTFSPANESPTVTSFNLASGSYVSGEKELKLVASDPDGDNISLSVDISSDEGKSWKELEDDLRGSEKKAKPASEKDKKKAKKDKGKKSDKKEKKDIKETKETTEDKDKDKSGEEAGESESEPEVESESEPETESEKDPEKETGTPFRLRFRRLQSAGEAFTSSEVKGSVLSKTKSSKSTEKKGSTKKDKSKTDLVKTASDGRIEWTWDTKKHKDGVYMLRFRLSDSPSNGGSAGDTMVENFYRTVIVDNSAPALSGTRADWSSASMLKEFRVETADKLSPVVNAVIESDHGESWALAPVDGLADSKSVVFLGRDLKFKKKPHSIKLEVSDKAGNKAKKEIKITK